MPVLPIPHAKPLKIGTSSSYSGSHLKRWKDSYCAAVIAPHMSSARKARFHPDCVFYDEYRCGEKDVLLKLLRGGVDVNTYNSEGVSPLPQACVDENRDMFQFLVEQGANANVRNKDGWTPLRAVADSSCVGIARYLVQHGADLQAITSEGRTPLGLARKNNGCRVIKCSESFGCTPLNTTRSSHSFVTDEESAVKISRDIAAGAGKRSELQAQRDEVEEYSNRIKNDSYGEPKPVESIEASPMDGLGRSFVTRVLSWMREKQVDSEAGLTKDEKFYRKYTELRARIAAHASTPSTSSMNASNLFKTRGVRGSASTGILDKVFYQKYAELHARIKANAKSVSADDIRSGVSSVTSRLTKQNDLRSALVPRKLRHHKFVRKSVHWDNSVHAAAQKEPEAQQKVVISSKHEKDTKSDREATDYKNMWEAVKAENESLKQRLAKQDQLVVGDAAVNYKSLWEKSRAEVEALKTEVNAKKKTFDFIVTRLNEISPNTKSWD